MTSLYNLMLMVLYSALAFVIVAFSYHVLQFRGAGNETDSIKQGNVALATRHFGYLVGLGMALSGVFLSAEGHTLASDVASTLGYGLLATAFMLIALFVNDKAILHGVDNNHAVRNDRNLAIAVVEAGGLIATGQIALAALQGNGSGVLSSVVFFALGQLAMVASILLYEKVKQLDIVDAVESGNLAAGFLMAGKLICYGLVLKTAVAGDSTGWTADLLSFALTAGVGIPLVFLAEYLVDLVIVRWTDVKDIVRDNNVATALVITGGKIGVIYTISTLVV